MPDRSPPAAIDALRARFLRLPRAGRTAVVAVVLVPLAAFAAAGIAIGPAPGGANAPAAPNGTVLLGSTAILPQDPERVLADIARAGPAPDRTALPVDPAYAARAETLMAALPKDADGQPDWARIDMAAYVRDLKALGDPYGGAVPGPVEIAALDLDDALATLAARVDAENPETLDALRDSPQGREPAVLLSHSLTLLVAGDVWGAAANLLVAHEADPDDATPLVNLAALANGQQLPAVALALLGAAEERPSGDDDSPVGIRERATRQNNRGHALLLLRRYAEAEAPLRDALALSVGSPGTELEFAL